ncbi:tyrosinase family protein [Pseudoalteromonas luteoviolacea]|nr:tyrosinase family protein [Pseudoalteromonas luteoviolacea]
MRIRKNVNEIKDGTLLWYSKAVEEMKKRDISDPTSWWYQGAIHGFGLSKAAVLAVGKPWSEYSVWAQAVGFPPSEKLVDSDFWQQCQHGSWFFLPWHRMYLQYFEAIVRKTIIELGGPDDWSLPYWNYCDGNNLALNTAEQNQALHLPPEFGTTEPNPDFPGLWIEERAFFSVTHNNAACESSMRVPYFASTQGEPVGFGGQMNTFSHNPGTFGALEDHPHNKIHVAISGAMGDPNTAALDPIFWLHHANIDRLWQNWIQQGNSDPDSSTWLNQTFDFHDENALPVTIAVKAVLNTEELGYTYSKNYPLNTSTETLKIAALTSSLGANMFDTIAATTEPLKLTSTPASAPIDFLPQQKSDTNLKALSTPEISEPTSVIIMLENITGEGVIAPIDVFIRVAHSGERIQVGSIGLFGLSQASTPSKQHAGTGINAQLDATDVFHTLRAHSQWQLEDIHIEVEPSKALGEANATIGRISIKAEV